MATANTAAKTTSIAAKRNTEADIGENISVSQDGDRLTIVINLAHRGDLSASGKTVRVASTGGNHVVAMSAGKPVYLGLNAYVKP